MRRALILLLLLFSSAAPAAAVTLARRGKATLPIVLAREALPAEHTAAQELASYLDKVTSGHFPILIEGDARATEPAIFVGPTAFARRSGLDAAELLPEEWRIRSTAESLVLVGGRPRGTLYAVYHFLEDHVGVRWWTPFEESVPRRRTLAFPELDAGGRPAFVSRDITTIDGPREFCARNRINGHMSDLSWAYGGREAYGPPGAAHTFFDYVPPDEYFEAHPDYFSELDGERTAERSQLCLTNPALLDLVEARLRGFIAQAQAESATRDEPVPRTFVFSPNDRKRSCTCSSCRAIAEREGGQAGPLVLFLNRLAQRIEKDHPDVRLDTLAYLATFDPPRDLLLAETVSVRLSALQYRNFSKPVTDLAHRRYQDAIAGWRRVTRHLRIWDYSVTFGQDGDLPLGNLRFLAPDYRYYLEHGVEGMLVQHEHPISADLRDLKLWVMAKLLEDPYQSYETLLTDFTDGYYGKAGESIRSYLGLLEAAADKTPAKIGYPSRESDYHYLDRDFLLRAHEIFDQAERQVAHHKVLSRRVRHARLSLDRATLLRWDELIQNASQGAELQRGRARLSARAVADRYRRTWYEQMDLRGPASESSPAKVEREIARLLAKHGR